MGCAITDKHCHSKASSLSGIGQCRTPVQQFLPFAVFGSLWLMLIANLSQHWAANSQYSFGWLVPGICAYLFVMRWRNRLSRAFKKLSLRDSFEICPVNKSDFVV